MNPYYICGTFITSDKNFVIKYLRTAFNSTQQSFFAPYNQNGHWVLVFISHTEYKGIILDSVNRTHKKMKDDYLITDCITQAWGPLQWNVVKCNQQPGSWGCGYYVLNWMHSIVHSRIKKEVINIDELSWDERCLSTIDLDNIMEKWHLWSPF
ncbi:uncharacterized protein [Rutidosis leptorrhynchoides]|uniref:uncharacterized protein n=1 Tax=Rutidosis leptorrhynchoides TaxID=125765 RepID=UPI003A995CDE